MTIKLDLDKNALIVVIEHVIAGGVSGILILETNVECASLNNDIRQEVNGW